MMRVRLFVACLLIPLLVSMAQAGNTKKPGNSAAGTASGSNSAITSATKGGQAAVASDTLREDAQTTSASAAKNPSSGEQIQWQVISAGGTTSSNANFIISQTVAQTATGVSTGGSFALSEGFFYSGAVAPPCKCGDADNSGGWSIGDAVYIINYIFGGGPPPLQTCNGDADGSGGISIGDAVYLINYIFGGGPMPGGC